MTIFEYSGNIRELTCILVSCIPGSEYFVYFNEDADEILGGHIGVRDNVLYSIFFVSQTFLTKIQVHGEALMVILQSCRILSISVTYQWCKVEITKLSCSIGKNRKIQPSLKGMLDPF